MADIIIDKRPLHIYEVEKYLNPINVSFLRGYQRILYGNDKYIVISRTEPGNKSYMKTNKFYYIESINSEHDVINPGIKMILKPTSGRISNTFIKEECSKFWILPSKREIHQIGDDWWIVNITKTESKI